jgi:hypothetical protein
LRDPGDRSGYEWREISGPDEIRDPQRGGHDFRGVSGTAVSATVCDMVRAIATTSSRAGRGAVARKPQLFSCHEVFTVSREATCFVGSWGAPWLLVRQALGRWSSLGEMLRQHPDLATERLRRVLETMNIILEQFEALTRVPGRPPVESSRARAAFP